MRPVVLVSVSLDSSHVGGLILEDGPHALDSSASEFRHKSMLKTSLSVSFEYDTYELKRAGLLSSHQRNTALEKGFISRMKGPLGP